ncbi:ScbA/BarX family gamma-butyrolactone biosynthesis protein [Streptomyces sp. NBC_01142]|uniref:ScbA/BarX family gamma-butyrolactone biosynthesis protein n=1 Tax=Streptomyces sp. NBC_01142 TaxID=2975865 RepID=UPI00224E48FE|nr:ScbA/BarX family gamma-butyrolactone biosynthesis protein [Streptomyces sp. NBC_01142]MCX4824934.1 ScbA/BarX family gamma-butyrolactone biosynthesis protein [Streptomyces sp. NBC_01142]
MTSTVPRQLVHRAAVAEVFLTGWTVSDDDRIRVFAQWPRAHSFYTPILGHYDSMLAGETVRQAGVLVAHAVHDVPLGHRFLMWDLHFAVHPENLTIGNRPADLELDVVYTEIRRSGSRLSGSYTVTARHEGRIVATGGARFTCTSPAVYQRLRNARTSTPAAAAPQAGAAFATAPTPLPPATVGRTSEFDVVLAPSETPQRWQLHANTGHPILFDHLDDHIPGMVLLEAARQAAVAMSPPGRTLVPVSMDSTFHRYVEFDSPCWIDAEPVAEGPDHPAGGIRLVGHQDGETVFGCLLTTAELTTAANG